MDTPAAWLSVEGGTRLPIGRGGVLVGRDPRCDIVLADPTTSRQHLLVRADDEGVVLHVFGRVGATVGGAPADAVHRLADGDQVRVPGVELQLRIERPGEVVAGWLLELSAGAAIRLAPGRHHVGAELQLAGWSAGAFALDVAGDHVTVEAGPDVQRNGAPLPPGLPVELYAHDTLEGAGPPVTLRRADARAAPTKTAATPLAALQEVEAILLARGGQLRLRRGGEEARIWLAERRFTLILCLLEPRVGVAGDDIADEEVLARVWPRQPHKSRVDLNVLVGRVRADLEAAGASRDLLRRAEGGGATRFQLDPGTVVRVG